MPVHTLVDDDEETTSTEEPERLRVRVYDSFDSLPTSYDALFEHGSRQSFCLTRWWFESLAHHIMVQGDRLCLLGAETSATPRSALGLLIGRERSGRGLLREPHRFLGLSNYYSMVFAPLLAVDLDPSTTLEALAKGIAGRRPAYDILRLTGLDPSSPVFDGLQEALRASGYLVQTHFHMGNWYEPAGTDTAAGYLSRRPSRLRNTLRRKRRALEARGAELKIFTEATEVDLGIADYERTYANSWQRYEPYPGVIRDLLRNCAAAGALRLGVLYLDGVPIASQIWILWSGTTTLYKLAHDRRFDSFSPGTVLCMRMIERLIEHDRVTEIDFGIGDDVYKSLWASQRRELWGIAAFNPRSLYGALGALRHIGGKRVKRLLGAFH